MMKKTAYIILAFCALSTLASPATAQEQQTATPIEITADKSLEWHRNETKFIARQNAIAKQGQTAIHAQTLTALYRESEQSDIDIHYLTAEGDVEIHNETSTAYGDKAVYNVDTQIAVLTGENLKLDSPDQTITAREKFTYNAGTREAVAEGEAVVKRSGDTIQADTITAFFKNQNEDKTPKNNSDANTQSSSIDTMNAAGNVIITTEDEIITGDNATYSSASNTAEINGNVKITRGKNTLEGAKATVDLSTNISKMFGSAETGERVRGIFYPKAIKKEQE